MTESDPRIPGAAPAPLRPRSGRAWLALVSTLVLGAAALPYLWGVFRTPRSHHFWGATWFAGDDGLLLSVMWEGLRGHWLHRPPYATAIGPGALFYTVYALLGHVSAWTRIDPVHVFYIARFACGALFLAALYGFAGRFLPDERERRFGLVVLATGGGLGWLVLFAFRVKTVDFLSPEFYPFFSILSSLHFTLAGAALLWVLDALVPREGAGAPAPAWTWTRFLAGALLLALMQPFASIVACLVGALWGLTAWIRARRPPWREIAALALLAGITAPIVLHQYRTILTNPAYVGWRTQVHTPAAPAWQVPVAIGLIAPFALIGLTDAARRRGKDDLLLLYWVVVMGVLLLLPYYQSRRFDFAGYVPLAILGVRGLRRLRIDWSGSARPFVLLLNAIPSIVLVSVVMNRMVSLDGELFVAGPRWQAVRYLRDQAPERAVVLADPRLSIAMLASTPLRFVYAHPTENPDANRTEAAVRSFYGAGRPLPDSLLRLVDYIVIEEKADGHTPPVPPGFDPVWGFGDVRVFRRGLPGR